MVQGAAFADLPLMHGFEVDIPAQVAIGDMVKVDPVARHLIKTLH